MAVCGSLEQSKLMKQLIPILYTTSLLLVRPMISVCGGSQVPLRVVKYRRQPSFFSRVGKIFFFSVNYCHTYIPKRNYFNYLQKANYFCFFFYWCVIIIILYLSIMCKVCVEKCEFLCSPVRQGCQNFSK